MTCSFVCVKPNGEMYEKMYLVEGLLQNHLEELKTVLSASKDKTRKEFQAILSTIEYKNLQNQKEELLKMLS